MQCVNYARPDSVAAALDLLAEHGSGARILAGGTDLVIALRRREVRPSVVIDLKRIPELDPTIRVTNGVMRVGATTVMTDIEEHAEVKRVFPALAEAAAWVGSVQIRNRATLVGNICNGSPAADTAPPLLVYDASLRVIGPEGARTIPLDDFFVRSRKTTLRPGELVLGVDIPMPKERMGSAYTRMTRRRGTDLASITLCVAVDESGVTRISYGSVGPRPVVMRDDTGVLADPSASADAKAAILTEIFAGASPSLKSMRAGPEYRLAMLPVLGARALQSAIDRLAKGATV